MKNNEEPLPQKIRKEEENRQVFKTFKIPPKSIGGTAERQEKEKKKDGNRKFSYFPLENASRNNGFSYC